MSKYFDDVCYEFPFMLMWGRYTLNNYRKYHGYPLNRGRARIRNISNCRLGGGKNVL